MRCVLLIVFGLGCATSSDRSALPEDLVGTNLAIDNGIEDATHDVVSDAYSRPDLQAPCAGSSQACYGDQLLLCVEGGWTIVEPPCAFGCVPGGWCRTCTPATRECQGQAVVECADGGDGWGVLDTCQPPCSTCKLGACKIVGTCEGKFCGDDGCGNPCGWCRVDEICDAGRCLKQ
jgi:hypothetical protein